MKMTRINKYDYNVNLENSPEEFNRACKIVEKAHPELEKAELLIDVDGSTIQIYGKEPTEIIVYDDYDIGAVYVKSDVDLSEWLDGNKAIS